MYFDVDQTVIVATPPAAEEVLARAGQEIGSRRGRVDASSADMLVFSAPFWRANGLLYFLVRQLPLGISHGVLQVVSRSSAATEVRCRVSLLGLRAIIIAVLLLLFISAIESSARGSNTFWLVLLIGILGSAAVYWASVVETRRFLEKRLFAGNGER